MYSNPENVSLSLSDENILTDVEKEMVRALNRPASLEEGIKRVILGELAQTENKEIYDVIYVNPAVLESNHLEKKWSVLDCLYLHFPTNNLYKTNIEFSYIE